MWRYISKRILLFIPTIFLVSVTTFFLSKIASVDPINQSEASTLTDFRYENEARIRGLDKPNFYFSLTSQAYPDTLHRILRPEKREIFEHLIGIYGNADGPQNFRLSVEKLKSNHTEKNLTKSAEYLLSAKTEAEISKQIKILKELVRQLNQPDLNNTYNEIEVAYSEMKASQSTLNHYLPHFTWFGFDNQYHNWFSNFLKGDFGISFTRGQKVEQIIGDAISVTVILNIIALLIAFGIGIPLGVNAARKAGSRFDKYLSLILYGFYAMPSFWVAALLIIFLCDNQYGIKIFPAVLAKAEVTNISFLIKNPQYFILPIICLSYPSIAFIFRQMRGSLVEQLKQNYVRTARAKGLSEKKVVWNHAFPNAIFPIVTMIASIIPALITGSVAIEYIFNINGMGKVMLDATLESNWPVVFALMMMGTFFTMIGILIADLLYAYFDPRIKF